ncbi:peptidase [Alishewanella longhuensis]|uniref:Peptidase n=1 Tax=Alishewanella longhuensis TaxID=1091037 RepID=A0ABQ3KY12_9ALTE|nr:penicillin acylase family protein [Alishewanella longhuensis]GHG68852.1 peptidase [Alishewanella longhuensis]
MKIISWLIATLLALLLLCALSIYLWLSASLADYNGKYQGAVANPVYLERDQLGYLTVQAQDRSDAAYGMGFAHAQDRFFQMDLTRRSAAGELAELFGQRALEADIKHRHHRFRLRAEQQLTRMSATDLQLLTAYSRGVNDGLTSLRSQPFEYTLLRTSPKPWLESDTLLVIYSMYFDLQGKLGRDEYAMTKLKDALPLDWYQFLQQHSADWQAAIDQSKVTNIPMPATPYPAVLQQYLSCQHCNPADAVDLGSNNFAVSGQLSSHGAAILADDMHLSLRVPAIWYKTQLNWHEQHEKKQVTGLSLPGTPAIVVGSNGHIAWGFTNSTADWHDLIKLQLSTDKKQYLTKTGWQPFDTVTEYVKVRDAEPYTLTLQETQWGPVLSFPDQQKYALRWVAHDDNAVNLNLRYLEHAESAEQALSYAALVGIPAQNMLVADSNGNIGWTIFGPIPQRQLAHWDTAQDWSNGENSWGSQVNITDYPKLYNPTNDRLWSANARTVGNEHYALLGNGGYDLGARGMQIAESLASLEQADELALHQIQLDHRALLLARWQKLLLDHLTEAVAVSLQLSEFRQYVMASTLHASPDDIGYTLLRQFRLKVLELAFTPLSALLEQAGARSADLKYSLETPLWLMLEQERPDTVPTAYASWSELLLSAAQITQNDLLAQYGSLANANWGNRNTARIEHPLSAAIPYFGHWLNMPASPLAGDSHMPRVQHPAFGQSQRMVVAPGHEQQGILVIPAGQSGHPLSPFYRADHPYWQAAVALPFLPGPKKYQQQLLPAP